MLLYLSPPVFFTSLPCNKTGFRFQLEYAKSERSSRRNPDEAGGLLMKYDIRAQIGKGSFAKVHRAINKKTGQWCAVKVIDKKRFKHNPKTMAMLAREVTIMQTLDNVRHTVQKLTPELCLISCFDHIIPYSLTLSSTMKVLKTKIHYG
jgi:serine/threonine protein kinase